MKTHVKLVHALARHQPIHWQRVNRLPGYVYFDHSILTGNERGRALRRPTRKA